VESEKQREKEAVYQAQRQKIFQEKVAGPHWHSGADNLDTLYHIVPNVMPIIIQEFPEFRHIMCF
jgi:hypothetical protein